MTLTFVASEFEIAFASPNIPVLIAKEFALDCAKLSKLTKFPPLALLSLIHFEDEATCKATSEITKQMKDFIFLFLDYNKMFGIYSKIIDGF